MFVNGMEGVCELTVKVGVALRAPDAVHHGACTSARGALLIKNLMLMATATWGWQWHFLFRCEGRGL